MSTVLTTFYVLMVIFFAGYGLKCYQCASAKSWDDCASNKKETTCPSGSDRCGKAFIEGKAADVSVAIYGKGCSAKALCDDRDKYCKAAAQVGMTVSKCEVNCCEGDLCNGAKVPMVSAILLLACALVAFFRWFQHNKLCSSLVHKKEVGFKFHK